MWYDCLFAFRRLISGVLLVRRVGQPLNENQSRRHKPLSQVCHGFVEVRSLVAKIESALWSQLSPKISAQFDGQFFVDCRQWFQNFFGIASSRSVIGSGNSCHPLNQSDNKPRTKRAWPLVFSRPSGSLPVLTLKCDWLLVTFPFSLIALFSLWYHSTVLRFFQVLSIECPKTEKKVITTYYQSEQMLSSLLSSKNRKLEARENASDQSGIDFCSAFDWLKWRREFSGPIKEQSKTKPMQLRITFDYQLKSALFYVLEFSAVHVILKKSEEKGYISNWNLSVRNVSVII